MSYRQSRTHRTNKQALDTKSFQRWYYGRRILLDYLCPSAITIRLYYLILLRDEQHPSRNREQQRAAVSDHTWSRHCYNRSSKQEEPELTTSRPARRDSVSTFSVLHILRATTRIWLHQLAQKHSPGGCSKKIQGYDNQITLPVGGSILTTR